MSRAIAVASMDATDKQLVLGNAWASRVLSIGTDWRTLRIGVRWNMPDTGATISSTPRLYLGAQASPTSSNHVLGSAVSHFVGLLTTASTWVRQGSGTYYGSLGLGTVIKYGSTTTSSGSTALYCGTATRGGLFLELYKNDDATWQLRYVRPGNSTAATTDLSKADFLRAMETAVWTEMNDASLLGAGYAESSANVAVSESTRGYLNAIHVAWNLTSAKPRISDIYWAKIA